MVEIRETVISRITDDNRHLSLNIGDKILKIIMERRYRDATPTTKQPESYPNGVDYDVEQEIKEIVDYKEKTFRDEEIRYVVFDDGTETHAERLLDRLEERSGVLCQDELDEHRTIYEKH